jgi:hypothetical protein
MNDDPKLPLILEPGEAPPTSVDDLFEEWWRQYPRRVAKGAARKAFKRTLAKKIASFDQLLNGAMRYAAERHGEDPQFTKHPASWLNGECWLDEPKPKHRKPMTRSESATAGILEAMFGHSGGTVPRSRASAREGLLGDLTPEDFLPPTKE